MHMHRDIDRVIRELRRRYPDITVEQLQGPHPADDDGIWYFTHPAGCGEVQVESSTGAAPFLVEGDDSPVRSADCSVEATIALVVSRLGLEQSASPNER
jgi:hypothetical protein